MNRFIILLLLITSLAGCTNNAVSPIPSYAVSLEINILQDAPELNAIGGVAEFTSASRPYQYLGFGGIVIFHNFDDQFVAFDMACPHEIDRNTRVSVNMAGQAVCPKCGSTFDVGYSQGFPVKGPARYPMKQYHVGISGDKLRVYP